jgi:regulator of replication initiation timing
MPKYDVGELITALNEAVNKLNILCVKYDDLEKERDALKVKNEKLREALRLAFDAVEHWASYASPYAQEKHDLAGDLQKLRAALGEKK